MFDEGFLQKLKERYTEIHPLIFHRSVERAATQTELFEMLESFPKKYPIVWSDEERKWMTTKDLFQLGKLSFRTEKK